MLSRIANAHVAESSRDIQVRLATPEDYEEVLDINRNVYNGADYMPRIYHAMVTDPDFRCYVCLINEEVVAFEGICLLDDNNTLMLRSLRIKKEFQGQGVCNHFRRRMYQDFKDFPGQKRLRQANCDASRFTKSKTFLSKNRLVNKETRILFGDMDVRKMNTVSKNYEEAKPISWEDFGHMLDTESVKSYLYPKGIMACDFWFFDAIASNIRHLKRECKEVLVTQGLYKFLRGSNNDNDIRMTKIENGNKQYNVKGLLGIVRSYFSSTYFCIYLNISGDLSKGKEKEEISHLITQCLVYVQGLYKETPSENRPMKFAVECGLKWSQEFIFEAGKLFGFGPAKPDYDFRVQYYFEQDFEQFLP